MVFDVHLGAGLGQTIRIVKGKSKLDSPRFSSGAEKSRASECENPTSESWVREAGDASAVHICGNTLIIASTQFLERARDSRCGPCSRYTTLHVSTKVGKHQQSFYEKKKPKSLPMRFSERTRKSAYVRWNR